MKCIYRIRNRAITVFLAGVMIVLIMGLAGCGDASTDESDPVNDSDVSSDMVDVSALPDHYLVKNNTDTETNEGIGILTAYDPDGKILWSAVTERYPMTELSKTYDIGERENGYYLEAGGSVYCFNKLDGSLLWKNDEFAGSATDSGFDEDGNLYICGYYGPMLCVISPNGDTLHRYDEPNITAAATASNVDPSQYYWPSNITVKGDKVEIRFDGNNRILSVDPETGECTVL